MNDFSKTIEPLLIPAMVALVGLACFGLGRLSVSQLEGPRLVINGAVMPGSSTQAASVASAAPLGAGKYVASKNGSKYYLPSCGGANRINEENKVWFDSTAAAVAAGYGPAANCPGL